MKERRDSKGRIIASEATVVGESDMIARWVLAGERAPFSKEDEQLVDVPFSLVCGDCSSDVPDGIKTREQAIAAGWTRVEFTPEAADRNYEGTCPGCREAVVGQ